MNLPDIRRVKRFLINDNALEGLEKLLNWLEEYEDLMLELSNGSTSNFAIFNIPIGEDKKEQVLGIAVTEHWFIWQDIRHRWSISHRGTGMKAISVEDRDIAELLCKRLQELPGVDWSVDSVEKLTEQTGYDRSGLLIRSFKSGNPINTIELELDSMKQSNEGSEKQRVRTLRMKKGKKGILNNYEVKDPKDTEELLDIDEASF